MKKKQQPWYYYTLIQYVAVGVAAIVLLVGILFNTPKPHVSKPLPYREATEQEIRQHQEKQLRDLLEAQHGN